MGGHDTTGAGAPEQHVDPEAAGPIVFYDGDCGLCHATLRFLLPRDTKGAVRYAPLQGSTWSGIVANNDGNGEHSVAARAAKIDLSNPPDSVILLIDGELLIRTRAMRRLLAQLKAPWPAAARLLGLLPTPLADLGYRFIAATRHRLFRRPEGLCPLVAPELRQRFLD